MRFKTDKRLIVYLNDGTEDVLFRDRVAVAAKTLGVSQSALIKAACAYALDRIKEFKDELR